MSETTASGARVLPTVVRRTLRSVGAVLLAVGAVFVTIGVTVGNSIGSARGDERSVTGTVVSAGVYRDSDGDPMCRPTVAYTLGGASYQVESTVATSHCRPVGTAMDVAIRPDGSARVVDGATSTIFLWVFGIVGGVSATVGIGLLVAAHVLTRKRRSDPPTDIPPHTYGVAPPLY